MKIWWFIPLYLKLCFRKHRVWLDTWPTCDNYEYIYIYTASWGPYGQNCTIIKFHQRFDWSWYVTADDVDWWRVDWSGSGGSHVPHQGLQLCCVWRLLWGLPTYTEETTVCWTSRKVTPRHHRMPSKTSQIPYVGTFYTTNTVNVSCWCAWLQIQCFFVKCWSSVMPNIKTLWPIQNDSRVAEGILKWILLNAQFWIQLQI